MTKAMPFAETLHCTSGIHCNICRDLVAGRRWRVVIGKAFALPADAPDFACPHGKSWGAASINSSTKNLTASSMSEQIAVLSIDEKLFADRVAVCKSCDDYASNVCKLFRDGHCTPCEFKAYLKRPAAVCPKQARLQWGV